MGCNLTFFVWSKAARGMDVVITMSSASIVSSRTRGLGFFESFSVFLQG